MKLPPVYPILDTGLLASRGVPAIVAAEALLEAGARIVQLRHKAFFSRETYEHAAKIASLAQQAGAQFVINDRADIALLLDAALHLGQEDLPPTDARKLLPHGMVGFSTHNEAQLVAGDREPVDYLAIGPIFSTGSKQNPDPVVGVEELGKLRALTQKPLVAIGGINRMTAQSVWQAGADTIAIIGDLIPQECSKAALRSRMEEWVSLST